MPKNYLLVAFLAITWYAAPACAQFTVQQSPDFFTPTASVVTEWDDNLFRLPSGEPVPSYLGGTARSDESTTVEVGLSLSKYYGQQRIAFDLELEKTDYGIYHFLNYVAKNGNATWSWSVTPDVTGHFLYTRAQTLDSFTEFTTLTRNISTTQVTRADIDWRFSGELHVGGAVYETTQLNTSPIFESDDARTNSVELNTTYESAASNTIEIYGRYAGGTFLNQSLDFADQIDTAFTENEFGLRGTYNVDGQTSFFAEIGKISRENRHFSSRNFSGWIGQLNWSWLFTGKTSGLITASRSIAAYVNSGSSYVVTNKVTAGPSWQATGKISINGGISETMYQFQGPIQPQTILRNDHIAGAFLNVKWEPVREIDVTAGLNRSTRHSNLPGLGYVDNIVTVGAKFNF